MTKKGPAPGWRLGPGLHRVSLRVSWQEPEPTYLLVSLLCRFAHPREIHLE